MGALGWQRRRNRGAFGGDGAAATPLYAVAQLSSANVFAGAAGQGPAFSATTGAVGMVWRKIIAGNLTREYRVQRFTSVTRGWRAMVNDGTTARLTTTWVSAVPGNVSEQNTVSPAQNLIHRSVAVNRGGTLEEYLNGALSSVGTALPSYTAPTTEAFQIQGSSTMVDEFELISVTWIDSALDSTAVAAWDAQVVAGGSRAFTGAAGLFDQWDGTGTWVDSIGGLSLTVSGSPVRRDITGAAYA